MILTRDRQAAVLLDSEAPRYEAMDDRIKDVAWQSITGVASGRPWRSAGRRLVRRQSSPGTQQVEGAESW
jgi:hypothetical protein